MPLKATIDDVAPPGWLALGWEFAHCAQIDVTAADAITTLPIFTYEADVSGLAFVNPDHSDWRVLYYNGSSFEEIDSDVRDIMGVLKVYFPAQINLAGGASDTTSYWLFWNSTTAVATKTNRDNIYLFYHDCQTKVNWNDYFAIFNVVAGEFVSTWAGHGRTLNTTNVGANDIIIYSKASVGNPPNDVHAGISFRADAIANNGWVVFLTPFTNRFYRRYWTGAANSLTAAVPYVCNWNVDYIIKSKMVGNNFEAWVSTPGTPIVGAPLLVWADATGATDRNVGFCAHVANGSTFDNLYVLHAVTNEPTVTLGATQTVADIMPKNITAMLHEPAIKIATLEEITGITAVLHE